MAFASEWLKYNRIIDGDFLQARWCMLTFLLAFVSLARLFRTLFRQPESRALLFMAVAVIGLGTLFYHNVEGWRWLDALYFCVVTLVTIGYGDFTPKTDAGKLFTIVYIIIGLGILSGFIAVVGETVVRQRRLLPGRRTSARDVEGAQK
ncbi:MAG: two pore domain potassium channel family protein [Chloroflexi bacterium]|nr:two pore domain potassium channel family protein [Chloroflexota bacterium]